MAINPSQGPIGQGYIAGLNTMSEFASGVNVTQMAMMVMMERHNIVQDQVQGQFKDMQERNQWLKDAGNVLNELRKNRPKTNTERDAVDASQILAQMHNRDGEKDPNIHTASDFFNRNNIPSPSAGEKGGPIAGKFTQEKIDTMINNLKQSIETVSTNSQMEMIQLQAGMQRLNQTVELMSSLQAQDKQTMAGIIQKI
ncbi:MAG: hypothetical protein U1E70_16480 [Acetobacteraceae bacterium]